MRRRCCRCQGILAEFSSAESPDPDECAYQFTDLSTPSSGATSSSWAWTFYEGATDASAVAGTSAAQNPFFDWESAGDHLIKLVYTDSSGCSHTRQRTVSCDAGTLPGCDSFPTRFGALLENMPSAPIGSQGTASSFGGSVVLTDPHARQNCSWVSGGFRSYRFSNNDFTLLNGYYETDDNLFTAGAGRYRLDGLPEFLQYTAVNTGGHAYTIQEVPPPWASGNFVRLEIQVSPCVEGPGDVYAFARLGIWNSTATSLLSTIAKWEKTITLASGQKLRDYGAILMDPLPPPGVAAPEGFHLSADYALDANCIRLNRHLPTAYPATLTVIPNG